MLRFFKLGCVITVLALTGCSYVYGDKGIVTNRETAYLQAQNSPAITVPPGLSSSTIEAHFPVSDTVYPVQAQKVSLVPPDLAVPVVVTPMPVQANPRELTYRTTTGAIRKVTVPDYYFDSKTRAHGTPAGTPVGSVFNSISTWGNKHSRPAAATTVANAGTAQPAPAPVTNPITKNSENNPKLAQNTKNQNLPDYDPDAEKDAKEKLLKEHYFDRYSRR